MSAFNLQSMQRCQALDSLPPNAIMASQVPIQQDRCKTGIMRSDAAAPYAHPLQVSARGSNVHCFSVLSRRQENTAHPSEGCYEGCYYQGFGLLWD